MEEPNVLKFPSRGDFIPEQMSKPVGSPTLGEEGSEKEIPVKIVYDGLTNILPNVKSLIVIATDDEGRFFFASSELKKSDILYDLKTAEYSLMV